MAASKYKHERECWANGRKFVAGVDEVGMGCLAGPVVAAAVIFSDACHIPRGIDDSKKLTAKQREELSVKIRESAVAWAVGLASVEEIDSINIYQAGRLAMVRAVRALGSSPDFVLIDGRAKLDIATPQLSLIKGDQMSVCIGAASIVAKVHRDAMMVEIDGRYPGYFFAKHKGYGSVEHRKRLQEIGPSPIHRKSFSWTPV